MGATMEFGIFEEFSRKPGRTEAESFDESFELIGTAEEWGIDAVWLAEIHFAPERSVLAAPMTIAAGIAGKTERIKIGTAVQVLPLINPLRIAEDAATVDQISHGRLIFGVGRSGAARSYDAYGVSYTESKERFNEALEVIYKAWTEPSFSYEGKYHSFHDIRLTPKPYQQPHPPIRVAASSPDTYPAIGSQGFPIFVGVRQGTHSELVPHIEAYHAAYRAAGHPGDGQIFIRIPVYVADTVEQAISEPEQGIMQFFARLGAQFERGASHEGIRDPEQRAARGRQLQHYSFEQARDERAIVGTPDSVTGRIEDLRRELGLDGILAELNPGGLIPPDRVRHSLDLFCNEVMPNFK